jgi:hypothetical protein
MPTPSCPDPIKPGVSGGRGRDAFPVIARAYLLSDISPVRTEQRTRISALGTSFGSAPVRFAGTDPAQEKLHGSIGSRLPSSSRPRSAPAPVTFATRRFMARSLRPSQAADSSGSSGSDRQNIGGGYPQSFERSVGTPPGRSPRGAPHARPPPSYPWTLAVTLRIR